MKRRAVAIAFGFALLLDCTLQGSAQATFSPDATSALPQLQECARLDDLSPSQLLSDNDNQGQWRRRCNLQPAAVGSPPPPPPEPQKPVHETPVSPEAAPPIPEAVLEALPTSQHHNFALDRDGAKALAFNPGAKKVAAILDDDSDTFMRNDCKDDKWVVIELSQVAKVSRLELTQHELYSSRVKDFEVRGRQSHPRTDNVDTSKSLESTAWRLLGRFTAQKAKGLQTFAVEHPEWVRYLLVRFLTHHGSEPVCAINGLGVYGKSAVEELEDQLADADVDVDLRGLPGADVDIGSGGIDLDHGTLHQEGETDGEEGRGDVRDKASLSDDVAAAISSRNDPEPNPGSDDAATRQCAGSHQAAACRGGGTQGAGGASVPEVDAEAPTLAGESPQQQQQQQQQQDAGSAALAAETSQLAAQQKHSMDAKEGKIEGNGAGVAEETNSNVVQQAESDKTHAMADVEASRIPHAGGKDSPPAVRDEDNTAAEAIAGKGADKGGITLSGNGKQAHKQAAAKPTQQSTQPWTSNDVSARSGRAKLDSAASTQGSPSVRASRNLPKPTVVLPNDTLSRNASAQPQPDTKILRPPIIESSRQAAPPPPQTGAIAAPLDVLEQLPVHRSKGGSSIYELLIQELRAAKAQQKLVSRALDVLQRNVTSLASTLAHVRTEYELSDSQLLARVDIAMETRMDELRDGMKVLKRSLRAADKRQHAALSLLGMAGGLFALTTSAACRCPNALKIAVGALAVANGVISVMLHVQGSFFEGMDISSLLY